MSAISTYLEYIRSKIYAKDVRTAIVNAISQCYDDVNRPALQTEAMQAAVQAKIDAGQMAAYTVKDGTFAGSKLANGAITTAKLADGAVTAAKIASGVIPTVDATLTQTGAAADAKAVGDAFEFVKYGALTVSDIVQGSTSQGNPSVSTMRLRSGMYEVKNGYIISFTEGTNIHNIIGQKYDESGTWKGEWSGWKTTGKIAINYDGYVMLVFRRDSGNGEVTVNDYDAITTIENGEINITGARDELQKSIDDVNDTFDTFDNILDVKMIEPINKVNPNALTTGRYLYNGNLDTNASYKTTDYISVLAGDLLRFYKRTPNPAGGYVAERTTGERLALFDANKVYIGVSDQYPFSVSAGYTVGDGVGYVRVSYLTDFDPTCLTINYATDIWEDYFAPRTDSARLLRLEGEGSADTKKIIDCWGDSRTEMATGTSYTDYLATLLGDTFIVSNHGISGQAIGEIGFRFGSNEVFLTLNGNAIPASGAVDITGIICSVGSREGYNMETADATRGSRCSINGVSGTLVYQRNGTKSFTRDSDGIAISVKPKTKAIPAPYFDRRHMQILWAGKNDFSYAWPYIESGIEDNYAAMVSMIPHDKYLILGETYSSDYSAESTNRQRVDTINAYLTEKYPDNFINILSELVSKGLALEGITPTEQDETDIAGGFIPTSLMADGTHPNQYGREAIAKIIYAWMQDKQWI